MKKTLLTILGVIILLVGATKVSQACFLGFGGDCPTDPPTTNNTYSQQSYTLDQITAKLIKSVPVPNLQTSQERLNISRRAQLFDSENKISYIYLISFGKVMAFYTVKGKVSSLNSYMVPQDKLVYGDGTNCTGSRQDACYSVAAPDLDGSYGQNANGIFFFTTEGAYVEWSGDYMMSDQPLQMSTQPELVRQVQ